MNKLFKLNVLLIALTQFAYSNSQDLYKSPIAVSNSYVEKSLRQQAAEGFLAGTLIQTTDGYAPVELLIVGDILAGVSGDQEIIYIKQNNITQYVQLQIGSRQVNVASNQQFYVADGTLKNACDLEIGNVLNDGNRVEDTQIIDESCVSYSLCTEHHSFFIYPNIHVHNFDVATMSASGALVLGMIEVLNPIVLLVGIVAPLAIYAVQQFRSQAVLSYEFDEQDDDFSESQIALKNIEVLDQTRNYYEAKRKELLNIYQDLINIKNDLAVFTRPNQLNALTFSNGFLQQFQSATFNVAALPNISYEAQLSISDKEKLMKMRDDELEKLQQEILDVHLVLAFHISEIIERRDQAQRDLDVVMIRVESTRNQWNSNLYNMPNNIAYVGYEVEFIWQEMLDYLEAKTNEVKWVLMYYEKLKNHFFVSKTTTLLTVLVNQVKINNIVFDRINSDRSNLLIHMQRSENLLGERGLLSLPLINKYRAAAQKYRAEKENAWDSIVNAKKKQQAVKQILNKEIKDRNGNGSGGPGKDPNDPENENKFFKILKETAIKTARHPYFGMFYKDAKSLFWWSKDRARFNAHGGFHYKVFKERASELEWIFNADSLGRKIIDQHKSPTGKIIPLKELIFL